MYEQVRDHPDDFRGKIDGLAADEPRGAISGEGRKQMVAHCTGVADIASVLAYARKRKLKIAVGNGGRTSADADHLLLDLTEMRGLRIDPLSFTANVQAGVTSDAFTREVEFFNLAPLCEVSAAPTLCAGIIAAARRAASSSQDAAAPAILGLDLVTADGSFVQIREGAHPDLRWALLVAGIDLAIIVGIEIVLGPALAEANGQGAGWTNGAVRHHLPSKARKLTRVPKALLAYDEPGDFDHSLFMHDRLTALRQLWDPGHLFDDGQAAAAEDAA